MNKSFYYLFIFFLIIYIYLNKIKNHYKKKCLSLKFWEKKHKFHHKKLLKFITKINTILDKHNVTYWATAGTLLGLIRHNNFIPWDDDVDYGYLNSNYKINNALNELDNLGYKIKTIFFGYKVIDPNDPNVFLDLFEFTIKDDKVVMPSYKANIIWPKEYYLLKEIYPLKIKYLDNLKIKIPNGYHGFLTRVFGKDYMKVFYIQTPHNITIINDTIDYIGIKLNCNEKFYIKDLY